MGCGQSGKVSKTVNSCAALLRCVARPAGGVARSENDTGQPDALTSLGASGKLCDLLCVPDGPLAAGAGPPLEADAVEIKMRARRHMDPACRRQRGKNGFTLLGKSSSGRAATSDAARAKSDGRIGEGWWWRPQRKRVIEKPTLKGGAMTTIWDRAGYITIPVTQEHIDQSMARNSSHCMTALAIQKAIPDARHICVDLQTIRWTRKGLRYVFLTPHVAQDRIIQFDQGQRDQIQPFTLRMRPAQISRAGKKRRETPSDGELRGTGLTVNPVQLHIENPPQRFTSSGARNLDPERSDGLAPPKRVPRAKVSTAAKGSIPTTLGGNLPPISILSRREFGLRVLRK